MLQPGLSGTGTGNFELVVLSAAFQHCFGDKDAVLGWTLLDVRADLRVALFRPGAPVKAVRGRQSLCRSFCTGHHSWSGTPSQTGRGTSRSKTSEPDDLHAHWFPSSTSDWKL